MTGLITNPVVLAIGCLQLAAAGWSFSQGDWRIGVMNIGVGVANFMLATMRG